jgi:dimethylhistidine N-methyltransferase
MTAISPIAPDERFALIRIDSHSSTLAEDVRRGLTATPKSLPPRWFYDDLGSSLFDAICNLPEYYVTRAETEVLTRHREEIVEAFGDTRRIVELGSGSARKTRILFDAMDTALEYVPVDVDAGVLETSGRELLNEYAEMRVRAVCSDFAHPSVPMRALPAESGRTIVLFLGSTIGNLDPVDAASMLRDLRKVLRRGDALLLGADLRKSASILEPAYDDAIGVTAAFNRNVLQRINRELGADFDLSAFAHKALYDEVLGRIEMHLVSTRGQRVRIGELTIEFAEGESIHTESSYKHDDATLATLAQAGGFTIAERWTDSRGWFADVLMLAV